MRHRDRIQGSGQRLPVQRLAVRLLIPALLCGSCVSKNPSDWEALQEDIRKRYPHVAVISTQELADRLVSVEAEPVLLDVREPAEYAVSHLRGAVPAASEKQALDALQSLRKNHPIVVYCSVGHRSSAMAEKLQKQGFENVVNLEGSIFQWANEGRPVYAGGYRAQTVHPYDRNWGRFLDRRLWSIPPEALD